MMTSNNKDYINFTLNTFVNLLTSNNKVSKDIKDIQSKESKDCKENIKQILNILIQLDFISVSLCLLNNTNDLNIIVSIILIIYI